MKSIEILIISLSTPLLVGLYENGKKFDEISTDAHTSEALVELLEQLNKTYNIDKIIYANTPGSFMGLKVAYVILKTFCLVKGCEFCAVSGFELNGGGAIRANKILSFVRENGAIAMKPAHPVEFALPLNLHTLKISDETLPEYVMQAV